MKSALLVVLTAAGLALAVLSDAVAHGPGFGGDAGRADRRPNSVPAIPPQFAPPPPLMTPMPAVPPWATAPPPPAVPLQPLPTPSLILEEPSLRDRRLLEEELRLREWHRREWRRAQREQDHGPGDAGNNAWRNR